MSSRSLRASISQMEVGTLHEVSGLWSFQYAAGWLGNPLSFALSPHLPLTAESLLDGASKRPVQLTVTHKSVTWIAPSSILELLSGNQM